jgi:hypothetical protein
VHTGRGDPAQQLARLTRQWSASSETLVHSQYVPRPVPLLPCIQPLKNWVR